MSVCWHVKNYKLIFLISYHLTIVSYLDVLIFVSNVIHNFSFIHDFLLQIS